MDKFDRIYQRALKRKGGEEALQACLPKGSSMGDNHNANPLPDISDDRALSEMTRAIFQAGFVYRVVNQKWPGFEQAFLGFDPKKIILLSPEQIEALSNDKRIVRNMQKILSVPQNAQMILDISAKVGSFALFLSDWPKSDQFGLHDYLKKNGSRLGGMTGQRVLRNLGWDSYILTADVITCMKDAGIDINDNPTSKRQLKDIQEAFNRWHDESGHSYVALSRICACSVGVNYPPEMLDGSSNER